MTPRQKIAVSLPAELVETVRRLVAEGCAPNVSAYVERALAAKAADDDNDSVLDEMLAETGGPLTKAEIEWADRILLGSKRPSKKRR